MGLKEKDDCLAIFLCPRSQEEEEEMSTTPMSTFSFHMERREKTKKGNKVQKRSNPDRDHVWHPRERERKKGGLAAAEVSRKMVEGYNARGFRSVWLERPSHMSRRPASFHYSSTASPQIRPLSTERQFCSNGRPTLGHTHQAE
jgi:hypothetical protein